MVEDQLVELDNLVSSQPVLKSDSKQAGVGAPALPSRKLLSLWTQELFEYGNTAT
jgi:hypothetical protein